MALQDAKPSKSSLADQITFERLVIGGVIVCPCSGIAALGLSLVWWVAPGENGWKGGLVDFLFLASGLSGLFLGLLVLVAIIRRINNTT